MQTQDFADAPVLRLFEGASRVLLSLLIVAILAAVRFSPRRLRDEL